LARPRVGDRLEAARPGLHDDAYFSLLRNYRRYGWLILFLFGVSPAIARSFFAGREVPAGLEAMGKGTLIAPHATSLRMSDLGYRNKNQAGVYVSVNSLEEYVRDLSHLISTPHPEYEAQGVEVNGEWRQLNANLLQIENEYYSFIRPEARRLLRRAADEGAHARRRPVRRDALARRRGATTRSASTSASSCSSRLSPRCASCATARRYRTSFRRSTRRITCSSRAAGASAG
jgi:glutamate--cysteine ligase